jgi:hypothetical protein
MGVKPQAVGCGEEAMRTDKPLLDSPDVSFLT